MNALSRGAHLGETADGLLADLAALSSDPYRFVRWAFPWGETGTELEFHPGPESWQDQVLMDLRDGLLTPDQAIREAIASGHGVGKSALVAWIILWAISTLEDTKGVVTANTENQLKQKTWAELGKWFRLFIARSLFKVTATAIFSADPEHERTWRIDMVPWSERNTEAFAGLHNQDKRILLVFDEGSAIPDMIWEVAEGALTDRNTQIIWLVCGNPTRNTGRFRECFDGGRFAHRWKHARVDSRTVRFANLTQIEDWIKDYGEDSDFVRIRVLGVFPRAGTQQFISSEAVAEAMAREATAYKHDPLVIGVDVARFGGDDTVIFIRKGRDGRSWPPIILQPTDSRQAWSYIVASRVSEIYANFHADAVFVDGGGVGAGVVDALRQLHVPVWDIQFGAKADRGATEEQALYANKRAEMWGWLRAWLKGGSLPNDAKIGNRLKEQLVGPEYTYNERNEIQLERKQDMRARGLESPDIADALALTFAYEVAAHANAGFEGKGDRDPTVKSEYDPFSAEALAA